MKLLKVIAHLLNYPSAEVANHKDDMALVISLAKEISPDDRAKLLVTLGDIYDADLLDAEENYTGLFEQGRSLSLHLFEHVHGESRDRGQAMVDLMAEYSANGFEMDTRELPDYIPLFLEYLSYRSDLDAREWLADVSHILALLGARLLERESAYAHLFESLLVIAGCSGEIDKHRSAVAKELPDNTPEALDKEWEEVAVTFGVEDQACATKTPSAPADQTEAVRWVEPAVTSTTQSGQSL